MITEDDNYVNKCPQESGTCRAEGSSSGDNNAERILSDANNAQEEVVMTRKPILEQDRFLPIANISRLMKNVIPRSGKVAKDAKECVQECVSEFISFITSEACDRCLNEKRKTITGEDIIGAFATLGFDNYVEPLNAYVKKFREAFRTDRNTDTLLVESSGPHATFAPKTNVSEANEPATSVAFSIQSEPVPSSSACAPQIIFGGEEDPENAIRVMSTGNVQHLQLLMDPATGQHYINVQNANGTQQLLPVQVTAVADSSATPLTLACPDVQNPANGKTSDKEMLSFSTKNEYRSSLPKSENTTSTTYKELSFYVSQVTRHPKHSSSGLSVANQRKQQVSYIGNVGQFGHHHSNIRAGGDSTWGPPRKRSHGTVDFISIE